MLAFIIIAACVTTLIIYLVTAFEKVDEPVKHKGPCMCKPTYRPSGRTPYVPTRGARVTEVYIDEPLDIPYLELPETIIYEVEESPDVPYLPVTEPDDSSIEITEEDLEGTFS